MTNGISGCRRLCRTRLRFAAEAHKTGCASCLETTAEIADLGEVVPGAPQRLSTRPIATGSRPVLNTIGMIGSRASGCRRGDHGHATDRGTINCGALLFAACAWELSNLVSAAGSGCPIFPSAPGFWRIGLVAPSARCNLAFRKHRYFSAHAHGVQLHTSVARQING